MSDDPPTPPDPAGSRRPPDSIELRPIATIVGGRTEPLDDDWDSIECRIRLAEHLPPAAIAGLDTFSHVQVIFHFSRVDPAAAEANLSARPRGNPDWPEVGIFAQRKSRRPNRLGITTAEIVRVEGRDVVVRGLDAIDGTPVLDLKPMLRGFLPRSPVQEPAWATEIMRGYW